MDQVIHSIENGETGRAHELHRVVMETSDRRIVGDVMLPTEGYRNRFSDLLNREDARFISVLNAEITERDGERAQVRPFVAVARDHIRFAYELA